MMDDIFGFVWFLFWACCAITGLVRWFDWLWSSEGGDLHEQKRSWISWKRLAETNNLSFIPGKFSNGPKVVGKYRNHHLTLKSIVSSEGEVFTRITIATNNQAPPNVSPTSISALEVPLNVEDVVQLFSLDKLGHNIWGTVKAVSNGRIISYERSAIDTNLKYLHSLFEWLSDIADAYPAIVALGGKVVKPLHSLARRNSRLEPLLTQLLRDITNDTTIRLGYRAKDLLCLHCLTCCDVHKVRLRWGVFWETATYYGCRTCHQSREFFEGWVVALLDNQTTQEQVQQNGILRVNWLNRRALFDFDEVEIVSATDEDVERFAVQVGNDTDPLRKSRYQQMRCVVSADCGLSENTHRILQRMFGSVELRGIEYIRELADIHERTPNHRNRAIDPQTVHPSRCSSSSTFGR